MLSVKSIFKSESLSATILTSNYTEKYSEKDFNEFSAISFPIISAFSYKTGKHQLLLDSDRILFERPGTEFIVTKFAQFTNDVTISIQFLSDEFPLLFSNKRQAFSINRSPAHEVYLRQLMAAVQLNDLLLTEQLIFDLISITDQVATKGIQKYNLNHRKQIDLSKDFIHSYYSENINIREIASAGHFSPFHFSRVFKTLTGFSPYDYLIFVRIEHAKDLLKKDIPVTQVAFRTGFNSLENFSYCFRKTLGYSPTASKKSKISKHL